MTILLIGLEVQQLFLPEVRLYRYATLAEAESMMLLMKPELIIIDEQIAEKAITLLRAMDVQSPVAVVVEHHQAQTIRHWTAAGAKWVWSIESWEKELQQNQSPADHPAGLSGEVPPFTPFFERIEKETTIIAVAGAYSGAGATHQAMLIASYLSQQHRSVAIWEAGSNPCFDYLEYVRDGQISRKQRFKEEGITWIKATTPLEWLDPISSEYEFVILDLGELRTCQAQDWFFRADIPVLIASGSEWRSQELLKLCREYPQKQSRWRIVLPFVSDSVLSDLQDVLVGRAVYAMPAHADPFRTQEDTQQVLAQMFGMKTKKRSWRW